MKDLDLELYNQYMNGEKTPSKHCTTNTKTKYNTLFST